MAKDKQARARLVEIALNTAAYVADPDHDAFATGAQQYFELATATMVRRRAGMAPEKGHWCAAGLTAAMEDAGLVVPAPGTPARRGAVALLDFVIDVGTDVMLQAAREGRIHGATAVMVAQAQPGDIIAWKQNKAPAEWNAVAGVIHAYATHTSERSMCGKAPLSRAWPKEGKRCSACVWETRKGHVALIIAVDSESITTVGWNEGAAPGRVMQRRLWRKPHDHVPVVKPSSTVLYRRPGGVYGIARPVAR